MTLTFDLAASARFDDDYVVFLHFLDEDRELLWTADHYPPTPTRAWEPGRVVEYAWTILVPMCAYFGEVTVAVGLYSPADGARIPLHGDDDGRRAYRVGRLTVLPPFRDTGIGYASGWHQLEYSSYCKRWRWSQLSAVLELPNPGSDATLYVGFDHEGRLDETPRVLTVTVEGESGRQFPIRPGYVVQEVPLAAASLGTNDDVEVRLAVDRLYTPTALTSLGSGDTRELGVRVLGVFVQKR